MVTIAAVFIHFNSCLREEEEFFYSISFIVVVTWATFCLLLPIFLVCTHLDDRNGHITYGSGDFGHQDARMFGDDPLCMEIEDESSKEKEE